MRRLLPALLLASALLPAPAASAPTVDLRITELLPDPDSTLGQREFIELWNAGNATVDLQGWKLHDAPTASGSTNTFIFPAWSLPPNGRVVVWGGGAADAHGPVWSNGAAWNNAGDGAFLLDPVGTLVAWAGYGATTAPAGFEAGLSAKPERGLSTELTEGVWVAHEPTPGAAPGASAGTLALQVSNVAPYVAFVGLPASARPGTAVTFQVAAGDDNGAADVKGWNLTSNGAVVASGSGLPTGPVTLTAPGGTSWTLVVSAQDMAGLIARTTAEVQLRDSDLAVSIPAGGLAFPNVTPGLAQAEATQAVTLQNVGTVALQPLVDVSDFSGPAPLPAVGHLELGLGPAGSIAWAPYTGPLTPLPTLEPGQVEQLWFRVVDLPIPLPAGAYGTSFTVVAG